MRKGAPTQSGRLFCSRPCLLCFLYNLFMTWIVGAAATTGYAVGVSDVRVSFGNGQELDCLQKLYPMARFIAAGFAGSVEIGFRMLDGLAYQLCGAPNDQAFLPQEVADCFAPLAKDIFRGAPQLSRDLGSHIILLGAHPTEDLGIPGWAQCFVHVLKSPDFVPESSSIGEVVSIGSGSQIDEYRDALARFSADPLSLIKMDIAGVGASSLILSMVIQKTVERNPARGISRHAHICIVKRGSINIQPNDENVYPPNGEKIEFRMPPVATTWDEFVKRLKSVGDDSPQGATC
jgi:hypothetical protein